MSTFSGKFEEEEFGQIAVDKFTKDLYKSKAFFLSHFHSDHMIGLYEYNFQNLIIKNDETKLFCSEITKKLLLKRYVKFPESKIIALQKSGTIIKIKEGEYITVTPLHAGHCPGSIMLLFEGYGKRILYTGDFRLSINDLKKFKRLHDESGKVLPIDSVYLDTTFANPDYLSFPTREKSLNEMIKIIAYWLKKDLKNGVQIKPPANVGIEYIIPRLCKEFQDKVYVSQRSYTEFISCISDVEIFVTRDPSVRIHFCLASSCYGCGEWNRSYNVLTIAPKILGFTKYELDEEELVIWIKEDYVNVVYSSHSSLSEIKDFVDYIQPCKIIPSVVAKPYRSDEEVVRIIKNYSPSKVEQNQEEREAAEKICMPQYRPRKLSFNSSMAIINKYDLSD